MRNAYIQPILDTHSPCADTFGVFSVYSTGYTVHSMAGFSTGAPRLPFDMPSLQRHRCAACNNAALRVAGLALTFTCPSPRAFVTLAKTAFARKIIVLVSFCHDQFYHFLSQVSDRGCQ